MVKEKEKIKFETERGIFTRCLKERDTEVEKLKQEVYYLSTIISYIKTGDDPFRVEVMPSNISRKASYR
jgi:hypothetical protein